jgi:hypothetical protein
VHGSNQAGAGGQRVIAEHLIRLQPDRFDDRSGSGYRAESRAGGASNLHPNALRPFAG